MSKRIGDKEPYEYHIPNIKNLVKCSKDETLFVFGSVTTNTKYRWCVGIGRVIKIQIGENFDLVTMNFGRTHREIIVQNNHARRQIYTLKCGQLATYYGQFRIIKEDGIFKTIHYAVGFNAWFVPRTMDIKKVDKETFEELDNDNEKSLINLIDELTK